MEHGGSSFFAYLYGIGMGCLFLLTHFVSHAPIFEVQLFKCRPDFFVRPGFAGVVDGQLIFSVPGVFIQVISLPFSGWHTVQGLPG